MWTMLSLLTMSLDPKRVVTIRRAQLGPEDERMDREFWARLPRDERAEQAWLLTLELYELKQWDSGEPGLCRTVARVVRG
jgi:hypothetical protein